MSPSGAELFAAHQRVVRSLARPGGVLSPGAPTASVANPAWFVDADADRPTLSRLVLWRELLADAASGWSRAGRGRRAIVLAGPPGAGKTTVLGEALGAGVGRWAVVDADWFKVELLRRAVADGSYEGFLKPDAVRAAEAGGEVFSPLELAPLVHEESGALARALRDRAVAEGCDLVIDTVLSDARAAVRLGRRLDAAGYTLEARPVDVWTPEHIEAHFATCFVALLTARIMERRTGLPAHRLQDAMRRFSVSRAAPGVHLVNRPPEWDAIDEALGVDTNRKWVAEPGLRQWRRQIADGLTQL
ncbi:MAG: zeta toxin family protein, partial [Bifidobacteriaceae bacterium]|nr:zeta toxin family protein [Bifidobacteriaceae bacterium]